MGIAHPRLAAVALTETLHPAAPLTVPWTLSCSTDKKRQGVTGSSSLCIAVAQHSPAKAHTVSSVNVARALTCVSLRSYFKPTAAVPPQLDCRQGWSRTYQSDPTFAWSDPTDSDGSDGWTDLEPV